MTEISFPAREITEAEAAAMLRAVLNLIKRWRITEAQAQILLGRPDASTFKRWMAGEIEVVPNETTKRLGDLLGIHKALRTLFMEREQAYSWITKPNDAFGGCSALDRMLEGAPADIAAVRLYLEGQLPPESF